MLERAAQAQEAAPLEQLAALGVAGDLARDLGLLLVGHRRRVELVAERPEHRHGGPGEQRRDAAGLVVRHGRDVRGHRRQREGQRRAPLDRQPLRPRRCRRSSTPAARRRGARRRTARRRWRTTRTGCPGSARQPPVQLVHAEDVAVEELALAVGRDRRRPRLGDVAVHVPLDVVDRRAREHRRSARPRCGRRPRAAAKSSTSCCAALRPRAARDADRPVGMGAEQVAVRVDHLGLDPQAELEPQAVDVPDQRLDPAGQLAPVDDPVAERRVVSLSRRPNQPSSRTNSSTPRALARRRDRRRSGRGRSRSRSPPSC